MTNAYLITYLEPTNTQVARLVFQSKKTRRAVVPRNLEMTAEHQAEKLARALPGFTAFGVLSPNQWVYITEQGGKA